MKNNARFSCWTGPETRIPSGVCALPRPASENIINGEIEIAASNDQRMNTSKELLIGLRGKFHRSMAPVGNAGDEISTRSWKSANPVRLIFAAGHNCFFLGGCVVLSWRASARLRQL